MGKGNIHREYWIYPVPFPCDPVGLPPIRIVFAVAVAFPLRHLGLFSDSKQKRPHAVLLFDR